METLSLVLKILSALSLLIGLAQLLAGFLGVRLFAIPPNLLMRIGAGLLALAVMLGVADYWTGRTGPKKPTGEDRDSPIVPINNNVGPVVVGAKGDVNINQAIDKLEIRPGDSPAEQARKRAQARRIVAEEILVNLRHMDARLTLLDSIMEPDTVGTQLDDIRRKLAPGLQHNMSEGYDKLIAEQKTASLQQAFNSEPLRTEQGEAMVRLMQETEADPAPVRRFNDALDQVRYASEVVIDALRAPSVTPSVSSEALRQKTKELQAEQLSLAVQGLNNQSRIAYLYGLMALNTLEQDPSAIASDLAALSRLEPHHLISQSEAAASVAKLLTQEETRVERKAALTARDKDILSGALGAYAEIDKQLIIKPGDPWNMVIAKAITLRQFDRIGEAVAAFARYGEMFKAQDPGAEHYAHIAQKFTVAMKSLGVKGGVYVHAIKEGGPLAQAGLAVGDIVIEYADKATPDMVEMTQALADTSFGHEVNIVYLRLDPRAGFVRREAEIKHGDLAAELMPI
ncbi:PDZ domain-containing protein [Corallococcus sp. AS-1-6]|uniref:PDZ domain-containing protein n=1 Tax=Corallococcus sp. AS-1-6 TaxID=2874599 RepID=UPI001CBC82B4|nr:PDZ domain-containing protein [Corallococcus sp. AS-1-6]MBZ4374176.1 PDZ domain-containing protein [Corallococcus sp. AS-1-6]